MCKFGQVAVDGKVAVDARLSRGTAVEHPRRGQGFVALVDLQNLRGKPYKVFTLSMSTSMPTTTATTTGGGRRWAAVGGGG